MIKLNVSAEEVVFINLNLLGELNDKLAARF